MTKIGVLTGRGIAQVKLDACYAAERAPAPLAARLVSIVELSSFNVNVCDDDKGLLGTSSEEQLLSFFQPRGSVLHDCAHFTEESLGQN